MFILFSFFYFHLHTTPGFLSPNLTSHSSYILTPFIYGLWNPHYAANKQISLFLFNLFCDISLPLALTELCLFVGQSQHASSWCYSFTHTSHISGSPSGNSAFFSFSKLIPTIIPILSGNSLAHLELRTFGSLPSILITVPQALGTWIHHSVFLPIISPTTVS